MGRSGQAETQSESAREDEDQFIRSQQAKYVEFLEKQVYRRQQELRVAYSYVQRLMQLANPHEGEAGAIERGDATPSVYYNVDEQDAVDVSGRSVSGGAQRSQALMGKAAMPGGRRWMEPRQLRTPLAVDSVPWPVVMELATEKPIEANNDIDAARLDDSSQTNRRAAASSQIFEMVYDSLYSPDYEMLMQATPGLVSDIDAADKGELFEWENTGQANSKSSGGSDVEAAKKQAPSEL
ncbi:unnamed protein product, partial [Amoebophrya sp. A25]|eukprot:GSA25T00001541001.1